MNQLDLRTDRHDRHDRRRRRRTVTGAVAVVAALAISACGSDSKSETTTAPPTTATSTSATPSTTAGGSAPGATTGSSAASAGALDPAVQATADKAFLTANFDTSTLNPTVIDALTVASKPLTADQETLLFKCIDEQSCDLGNGGKLTIGFAETNGVNGLRRMWRLEGTAQALQYPDVGKVIYLDAHGDLQTFLSNFRSLISQKVDIIIGSFDLGEAVLPVVREATKAGIKVVPYGQIIPGATAPADYALYVGNDTCKSWEAEAQTAVTELGDGKTYGFYTGPPGNPYASLWMPCVEKILKAHNWKEGISGNTAWTPQGEQQAGAALIASGTALDALFYDYNAEGLVQPFIDAKKTPPAVFAQSNDAAYWTLYKNAQDDGIDFAAYVAAVGSWSFRVAVTAAVKAANGDKVDTEIILPTVIAQLKDQLKYYDPNLPALTPMLPIVPTEWVTRVLS